MIHLFENPGKLKDKLKNKLLFIFLDFDGTLAPIVRTPDKAAMPEETREALKSLSKKPTCKIAIISGRSLENIKGKFTGLRNIIYSGNHGLEIEGPQIKFSPLVPSGYLMAIKSIRGVLQKKIGAIKGALLEDKGLSLGLHYRLVDDKQVARVKAIFHEAVRRYLAGKRIKIKEGKKVWEVRPPLEWDKGKVVLWLLSKQKFAKYAREVLAVYIGDDLTDEDAFKALKRTGITVFVGRPAKASGAQYYLNDTGEVARLLKTILEMQS
ncbi:MAG: trehalose-phosphatase [Candidatus Omnitrophota bacterium]